MSSHGTDSNALPSMRRAHAADGRQISGALLSLLISMALMAVLWDRPINHDTAWYLLATREWLAGERLYIDIYEVNPPLNFYLTIPAILLADLTGMSETNAQYAVTCFLTGASLLWCTRLLVARNDLSSARRTMFVLGLGTAMVLPALGDIAQREHVLVIVAMPWAIGLLPGTISDGWRPAALRGAVAGLGICLKPFFLLFPIAATLWAMARSRSLSPTLSAGNIAMFGVGLTYVAAVWLLHPEYFRDIIPTARLVYGAIGASDEVVYMMLAVTAAPFVPLMLALSVARTYPPGTWLFFMLALAGLGSYLVQWTGFAYHLVPFKAFGMAAGFWILIHTTRFTPILIAALIALLTTGYVAISRGTYGVPIIAELAEDLATLPHQESLFVASTFVHAGPPLALSLGARWVSRYPHNWLTPGALKALAETDCARAPDRCAQYRAITDRNRDDNLADILAAHPDLIVIDKRKGYMTDPDFSWHDYYDANPDWARILRSYRQIRDTESFDVWSRCALDTATPGQDCR
ncbi:hypothetical protein [Defluviimonas sp. SAOS-178_SWC]|uniref:hypothetical protein n=1 Tax=Defluviimonas sp. SAOS-178_SWC TaxID=3121287 RepID=UPI003221B4A6